MTTSHARRGTAPRVPPAPIRPERPPGPAPELIGPPASGQEAGSRSADTDPAHVLRSYRLVPLFVLTMDLTTLLGSVAAARAFDPVGIAYGAGALLCCSLFGLHRPQLSFHLADDSMRVIEALGVPFVLLALPAHLMSGLPALAGLAIGAIVFVHAGRAVSYAALRRLRARRVIAERALIIGGGTVGIEIAKILRDHPEYGLIPAGFVGQLSSVVNSNPSALTRVVRELAVTRIIVAFSDLSDADLVALLRACASLPITVHVVPRLFELGVTTRGSHTDDIWGFPLVRVRASANRRSARIAKRAFDLSLGSILLVASLPVFAATAVAVRLSSPGPVFFRQKRAGEDGRIIEVLKFRTLLLNDDSDQTWSVHGDDRRTSVGRLLRSLSLDEFPQLLNVLRGEMSLVGPRPERPYFASRFAVEVRGYRDRHRVPQGITGWAQVHGLRGDTPIADRARFDNYYIENWSIWLDLRILAKTVAAVLIRRGE